MITTKPTQTVAVEFPANASELKPYSLGVALRFKARVIELGGELLETHYKGSMEPHKIRCNAGHINAPCPSNVMRRDNLCRRCADGIDRIWTEFCQRVNELGGEVLETEYKGSHKPHKVRCSKGHISNPRPQHTLRGHNICATCAYEWGDVWERFCQRVSDLGGKVLETEYKGVNNPHKIECSEGHISTSKPINTVYSDGGICLRCARGSDAVWVRFKRQIVELGGEVLETEYKGSGAPHKVRCKAGHICTPCPDSVKAGSGICKKCAYGSDQVWERFCQRVSDLGGEVLETEYKGARSLHKIMCREGHVSKTRPHIVNVGGGICGQCHVKYDTIYVLTRDDGSIKFGISSNGGQNRLARHRTYGAYDRVVFLVTGLPPGKPKEIEDRIKVELANAGYQSRIGTTEYFDNPEAINIILPLAHELARKYLGQYQEGN